MAIHSENILLEFSRRPHTHGWIKELVYRTLEKGELNLDNIKDVYEIFKKDDDAVSSEPSIEDDLPLKLCSIKHLHGVNALKENEKASLCEEGITVFYGTNGSGKSGYYRILKHLSGDITAKNVLPNIFKEVSTSHIEAEIEYRLGKDDSNPVKSFTWNNTNTTKGFSPFNRISCFDSLKVHQLIQQHKPNTYVLDTQGAYSIRDFEINLSKLITFCPDKGNELHLDKFLSVNFTSLYYQYLHALKDVFSKEVKFLIQRELDVNLIDEGSKEPKIEIKLSKPYEVEDVLSEGELKAISLALFIAEQELKPIKDPLIFDDPVNSLDDKIISRFERRLTQLDNPIILFTHNRWFAERLICDKKLVKRYSTNSNYKDRKKSIKHLFAYKVSSWNKDKGIISEYEDLTAIHYLNRAKAILDKKDYKDTDGTDATSFLRKSIEFLVDEKVFLGLKPCKYRSSHDSISWTELKKLKEVPIETIEKLEEMYGRLSGGGEHLGFESIELPLEHDELQEIYDELSKL